MRKTPNPSRFSRGVPQSMHITGKNDCTCSTCMSVHTQLSHNILIGVSNNAGEDNNDLFETTSTI